MPVPPENIQIGRCYLTATGEVRRVLGVTEQGRVHYEYRRVDRPSRVKTWRPGTQALRSFADLVEHPIPCGWTPGADDGEAE